MTRRELLQAAALSGAAAANGSGSTLEVPVLRVIDKYARASSRQIGEFLGTIWADAVRVFAKGGILLRVTERTGEVLQYPSGKPLFRGLERGMINVVVSDRVPLDWDKGRSLAGVSALYEGYCVCAISMNEAHGNRIPFLAVNTVVHELLHVLLQDVFGARTGAVQATGAEARVDLYATELWLFGDGAAVRELGRGCVERLRG